MYDRDYVKELEREIELTGGNRFRGWGVSTEKPQASETKCSEQPGDEDKLARRAAVARAS